MFTQSLVIYRNDKSILYPNSYTFRTNNLVCGKALVYDWNQTGQLELEVYHIIQCVRESLCVLRFFIYVASVTYRAADMSGISLEGCRSTHC